MAEKSLRQVGYEGYRTAAGGKSLVSGDPIPGWKDLDEKIRGAWGGAVRAIVAHIKSGGMKGVLKLLGMSPRQARREIDDLISTEDAAPDADAVLGAWDRAGGMDDEDAALDAALGVAGLARADLAPGEKPWHYREAPPALIIVLADGRRLEFSR